MSGFGLFPQSELTRSDTYKGSRVRELHRWAGVCNSLRVAPRLLYKHSAPAFPIRVTAAARSD